MPAYEALNQQLKRRFEDLRDAPDTRKTHWFAGRYENIYIRRSLLPEIEPLLVWIQSNAARILELGADQLRLGFWFNEMQPGQATLPHTHDDDDELLSAVYYLDVPPNSGNLVITEDATEVRVRPEPGLCVFFPPVTRHEVTHNLGDRRRLSLACNLGPRPADQ
jgi:hypothetical protein